MNSFYYANYRLTHFMKDDPEIDIDILHDTVTLTNPGRTKCTELDL